MHYGFKGRDGGGKVILPIVDQSDVETNSGDLRCQMFRFVQHFECLRPLLTPHGNHAQVGIGAGGLRILRQHAAKTTLGQVEIIFFQSGIALLK